MFVNWLAEFCQFLEVVKVPAPEGIILGVGLEKERSRSVWLVEEEAREGTEPCMRREWVCHLASWRVWECVLDYFGSATSAEGYSVIAA